MNFLAHAYLSGERPGILIGNLIGDTVKGKKYQEFPSDMQTGVLLHRAIDTFTDSHHEFKASIEVIRPWFGRYSGIVCDIYYDHFLAKHWQQYSNITLADFVHNVYLYLIETVPTISLRAQRVSAFMILRDWLGTYGNLDILHQIFLGMHHRTSQKGNMDIAVEILNQQYDILEKQFEKFMPEVEIFAKDKLIELLEK